jgi:hypothetical protein
MATALGLYNGALTEIGAAAVAATSEAVESARVLTAVYDNVVGECLASGLWQFAMRSVEVDADPTPPTFGYAYAFSKPADWVRTAMISGSERFDPPLLDFEVETAFWMADFDPIFVKYVSKDADYGLDLDLWPQKFARYVEAMLALRTCTRITGAASHLERLERLTVPRARADALAIDAMNGPVRFPPPGRWTSARLGGQGLRKYDRA